MTQCSHIVLHLEQIQTALQSNSDPSLLVANEKMALAAYADLLMAEEFFYRNGSKKSERTEKQ